MSESWWCEVDELIEAIRKRFQSELDFQGSLGGGLWLNKAPTEANYPFCVFRVEERPFWTFRGDFAEYSVRFDLFSKAPAAREIVTLHRLLIACFDEAPLDITGWHLLRFWRESSRLLELDEAWTFGVEYSCWTEKE